MQPSLRQAIARIDIMQGDRSAGHGTGCLIAGDLVLTAMHVVADRKASPLALLPGTIVVSFPGHRTEATVVEGRWDPQSDWALLRCATPPAGVRPVPLADTAVDGDAWETFGFPDANSRDGLAQLGTIENASGTFEGVAAYQLFSRQAAAGVGAPVKGLSGGPVIVEGALVGVFRSSLMREGQFNVAGTLYACPIGAVLDVCADLLSVPDPCRGLPGLPRNPLPAAPYRFLERFTARDAEIFFGRNREVRELYDRVTAVDGAPVVLLYGQSGAGKSSFLDAGLLPRLASSHTTIYVRRERAKGLLQTVIEAMQPQLSSPPPAPTLRAVWLGIEAATARPLVAILDQVEEAFTLPSAETNEVGDFAAALTDLLGADPRPRGRLVLGFRKEWLGEVQKALDQSDIDYSKVFLEALDGAAVTEITTGLTRTKRLRERYGLVVEEGLPASIAGDLTADRDSPVAPTLQVLLSRLWIEATAASNGSPRFTADLYARVTRAGFLLTDFLDLQLLALAASAKAAGGSVADVVESGLALDVLRFHISRLGTAEERTRQQLIDEYHRDEDVAWLVGELQRLFLLTEPAGDGAQGSSTRLAHDTLAAAVRTRCDESMLPGQRARRVLEARASEWADGQAGTPLDARDLMRVEQGAAGMRAWRADEERLIAASRQVRRRDTVRRRTLTFSAVAATLVIVVAGAVVWSVRQGMLNQLAWSNLTNLTNAIPGLLETQPMLGLVVAIDVIDRNLELNRGVVSTEAQERMALALVGARERFAWRLPADGLSIAMSQDRRVAVGTAGGKILVYRLDEAATEPAVIDTGTDAVDALSFSDDGELLAASFVSRGVAVWNRRGDPVAGLPAQLRTPALSVKFVPGGHTIVALSVVYGPDAGPSEFGHVLHLVDLDSRAVTTTKLPAEQGQTLSEPLAVALDGHRLVVATAFSSRAVFSFAEGMAWLPSRIAIGPNEWDNLEGVALAPGADGELQVALARFESVSVAGLTCALNPGCGPNPQGWTTVEQPDTRFEAVSFGAAARTVIAADGDGFIYAYDRQGRLALPPHRVATGVRDLAVSHDGALVAVAGEATEPRLVVMDTAGLDVPVPALAEGRRPPRGWYAADVAFLPTGQLVVAGPRGSHVWALEFPEGRQASARMVAELDSGAGFPHVAVDRAGRTIALAGRNRVVRLFAPDGSALAQLPSSGEVTALALSPDGLTVVTGSHGGRLVIADRQSGKLVKEMLAEPGPGSVASADLNIIKQIAFDPSGERFAAAYQVGPVRLYRRDGSALAEHPGQNDAQFTAVTFHPSGYLIGVSGLGLLRVLDGPANHVERTLQIDRGVDGLALNPSGSMLFAFGVVGVSAVDVASNALLDVPLLREPSFVDSVAVSPDGRWLVASDVTGLSFWRPDWQAWLAAGRERLRQHPVFTTARSGGLVDALSGLQGIEPYRAVDACNRLVWNAAGK